MKSVLRVRNLTLVVISMLVWVPAAQAARLARPAEAAVLFLHAKDARGCDFTSCRWELPIMSTRRRGWALLRWRSVDDGGNVQYEVADLVQRRGPSWVTAFETGGDAADCWQAARVPRDLRLEFHIVCFARSHTAGFATLRFPRPSRIVGPDLLHAAPAATIGAANAAGFGPLTSQLGEDGTWCTSRWARVQVTGAGYGGCSASTELSITTLGRAWSTTRGLVVGSSAAELAALYPDRSPDSDGWTYVEGMQGETEAAALGPLQMRGFSPINIEAKLAHGRVKALRLSTSSD